MPCLVVACLNTAEMLILPKLIYSLMKCHTNPYTFILCIGKLDKVILKYIREVKGPKIMKKKTPEKEQGKRIFKIYYKF